uniref:Thioredoxin-dependent peroxide reductase, mitochondrial n=1 Tax=Sinocyclocheilus rhinocerous TaxID=307959 RepID=A0A673I3G6_9TELE
TVLYVCAALMLKVFFCALHKHIGKMAATIGRLFGTSAGRAAVNGVKALVTHNGASVIRAPKPLACIAAQKACFSISSARWAPAVTQPAPHFKGTAVLNGEFKEISLEDFKGKYLVLFFYPLDFTFVCPTEIIAFSDKANEFRDINCDVIGVSVDSHFTHLAWTNTPRKSGGLGKIHIPLLADLTKQVSRDYGVLLEGPGIALRLSQLQMAQRNTLRRSTENSKLLVLTDHADLSTKTKQAHNP